MRANSDTVYVNDKEHVSSYIESLSNAEGADGSANDAGDTDQVSTEVEARIDYIRPVLCEKVRAGATNRQPHISGSVRAKRNLAEHHVLGAGTQALDAACSSPQTSQRNGRRCVPSSCSEPDADEVARCTKVVLGSSKLTEIFNMYEAPSGDEASEAIISLGTRVA